jgi:hypothetical protein
LVNEITSKLIYSPGDFIIRKGKFDKINVLGTIFAPKTEIVHKYLRTVKNTQDTSHQVHSWQEG